MFIDEDNHGLHTRYMYIGGYTLIIRVQYYPNTTRNIDHSDRKIVDFVQKIVGFTLTRPKMLVRLNLVIFVPKRSILMLTSIDPQNPTISTWNGPS